MQLFSWWHLAHHYDFAPEWSELTQYQFFRSFTALSRFHAHVALQCPHSSPASPCSCIVSNPETAHDREGNREWQPLRLPFPIYSKPVQQTKYINWKRASSTTIIYIYIYISCILKMYWWCIPRAESSLLIYILSLLNRVQNGCNQTSTVGRGPRLSLCGANWRLSIWRAYRNIGTQPSIWVQPDHVKSFKLFPTIHFNLHKRLGREAIESPLRACIYYICPRR